MKPEYWGALALALFALAYLLHRIDAKKAWRRRQSAAIVEVHTTREWASDAGSAVKTDPYLLHRKYEIRGSRGEKVLVDTWATFLSAEEKMFECIKQEVDAMEFRVRIP
ncbi:MAG TPA: hypothetical protein VFP46_01170 [Candidatus Paceibacterota bacterium]|nr:hypothetical protein [Candidatus Paceibacterota bacterium]